MLGMAGGRINDHLLFKNGKFYRFFLIKNQHVLFGFFFEAIPKLTVGSDVVVVAR
jgi:hypothetical protein